jgi:hypothetical protein
MPVSKQYTTVINIALPKALVPKIDQAAQKAYLSRSGYIRRAIAEKLEKPKPPPSNWWIVESLPENISDEELLKIVKIVRRGYGPA